MKVYIIQIDMGEGDTVFWENADTAYRTLEQAEEQRQWMQAHYGIEAHQLRIDIVELV
jgi:hypothetical protein